VSFFNSLLETPILWIMPSAPEVYGMPRLVREAELAELGAAARVED
jgi:hypothetical protein